jgi:succinate dehydrogenase hydrophobic anchor subunit
MSVDPSPVETPAAGTAVVGDGAGADQTVQVQGWGWHLLQVSTWLLVVLLLVQVAGTWMLHDPGHYGVAFYVDRWASNGWRIVDAAFVALALVHGGIGLARLTTSWIRSERVRLAIILVLAVGLGGVGLLAVSTILTFDVTP